MIYKQLISKINTYEKKYKVNVIGYSAQKRKIFAIEIINGQNLKTAILVGSIHARENISTDLLCKFLDEGLFDNIKDFNISLILMANPDGVELAQCGLSSVKNEKLKQFLLEINNFDTNFKLWKANINGVDLNNNFDAQFGKFVSRNSPSPQGYAGKFAFSENESKAVANYVTHSNAFFVVSYHTKGEEIYFNFHQNKIDLKRDEKIAKKFAKSTGYLIKNVENSSSGGLKDWCVQTLKIPSLTIELASDELSHPISSDYLDEIYEKNKNIANDLKFSFEVFNSYL